MYPALHRPLVECKNGGKNIKTYCTPCLSSSCSWFVKSHDNSFSSFYAFYLLENNLDSRCLNAAESHPLFFKVHSDPQFSLFSLQKGTPSCTPCCLAKESFFLSYRKYNTGKFHSRPSSWDRRWHSSAWMRRSKKHLVYNTFRPFRLLSL